MNKLSLAYAAAAIVGAVSFAAIAPSKAQMGHGNSPYEHAMTTMDETMAKLKMTGKPGVDFAMMMIPHHQSAIDMAEAYLASGENDPELTKLSNDIIAAQKSEIAFLQEWLKKNGQ